VENTQDGHGISADLVTNDVRVHDDKLAQIVSDRMAPARKGFKAIACLE